jgi:murein tripeptide amidase MpaA
MKMLHVIPAQPVTTARAVRRGGISYAACVMNKAILVRPQLLIVFFVGILLVSPNVRGQVKTHAILPPELKWNGKSTSLIVAKKDPWITPAEQGDFQRTPRYDETVRWLQRVVAAAPELKMITLGKSPEGRDLWMVVASKEKAFTPSALRAIGKPIFLAQAGIHAGEIDGKDAGLMLLRDMTVHGTKRDLLDKANFLFVPIFNVDGHERFSAYTRINQRGPAEAGWRTNARNLNLNRDYAKLDCPETRAMIRALNEWEPDLYFDLHVTDGADYQYDITFGYIGKHGYSPSSAAWLDEVLTPAAYRDLQRMGHIPGPLVFPVNGQDFQQGIINFTSGPRFSTAYGDARHLATVLVENHSLKPYKQRVLGTYLLLESTMRTLAKDGSRLREAVTADRNRRPEQIPLTWRVPQAPPPMIDLLAVEAKTLFSNVTNSNFVQWTGKPVTLKMPYLQMNEAVLSARRPHAYWIPPAWSQVIERLAMHGIEMEKITQAREVEVEMYRVKDPKLATQPFEGHVTVTATPMVENRKQQFPVGSVRISTDQPLGDLAALLLEPNSPDSFFQWGFFAEILSPTEYVEAYVMQPMAERMLAEEAQLKSEYEAKLKSDSTFAANSQERLQWFYERTPFYDEQHLLYPVGREAK